MSDTASSVQVTALAATEILTITNVSDTPDSFSPDGDGAYDSPRIGYTLSANALVSVTITNSQGVLIRTLRNQQNQNAGSQEVIWDSRDETGSFVPDGLYTYAITAVEPASAQRATQSGDFLADTRSTFIVVSPPVGSTLSGTVVLTTTQQADYTLSSSYNVHLYAYSSDNQSSWIGYSTRNTDGSWSARWDTTKLVNGSYTLRSNASYTDSRGSWKSSVSSALGNYTINNGLAIIDVNDSPDSFSPDGDTTYDTTTIYYTPIEQANVTITLVNSAGITVRTLLNVQPTNKGPQQVPWNGTDDSGSVVPDGLYTYQIIAADANGNTAVPQIGTVLVDTRPPLTVSSPAGGITLAGTVPITATQPADYTLSTWYGVSFYAYNTLGQGFWIGNATRQADGSWTVSWDTTKLVNDSYELRSYTSYTDSRGSSKYAIWTTLGSYTIDNGVTITQVDDTPDSFSPNGDQQNDSTTIRYTLSKQAQVLLAITNSAGTTIRTLLDAQLQNAGSQQVTWDGKADAGTVVADGLYRYVITARDPTTGQTTAQQGDVLVDTRPPLTVSSPAAGSTLAGTVPITATQPADYTLSTWYGVSFSVYNTLGQGFWIGNATRQADGSWTVSWDTTKLVNDSYELRSYTSYTDSRGSSKYAIWTTLGSYTIDNGVTITQVDDTPDSFSPNGDQQNDSSTIRYTLSKQAQVLLAITNSAGTTIRTLLDAQLQNAGSQQVTWDGKANDGTIVPDGLYGYHIVAADSANGQTNTQHGDVLVDTRPPLTVSSPAAGSTLTGTVLIMATQPADYGLWPSYGVSFYAYTSSNQSFWVGSATQQADSSWITSWDTTKLVNGSYELRSYTSYTDSRGSSKYAIWTTLGSYTIDNGVIITQVGAAPDSFSPNNDNSYDSTTLSYTLSKQANVTIALTNSAGTAIRTLLDAQIQAAGAQQAVWDGKTNDGTPVPDGLYTYQISASDAQGQQAIPQIGTVLVDTRRALTLVSPEVGSMLFGSVVLRATQPADYTFSSYYGISLYAYTSSNQSFWIGNATRQADGSWLVSWDTTTRPNGSYEIRSYASYTDSRGSSKYYVWTTLGSYTIINGATSAHITGSVRDTTGAPVAGATVAAEPWSCSSNCLAFTTSSASDGSYSLAVVAGSYRVSAARATYLSEFYTPDGGSVNRADAAEVVTTESNTTINTDFRLTKLGSIAGIIRDTAGRPVGGAQVEATYAWQTASSATNPDGSYTINGLPAGGYRIRVSKPYFVSSYWTSTGGTTNSWEAQSITVNNDQITAGISLALSRVTSIVGSIHDSAGNPIEGASVRAESLTCCSVYAANASSNGDFVITDITPGTYRVHAEKSGYIAEYYTNNGGTLDQDAATAVTVWETGATTGISITLDRPGSLSGTVSDENGQPLKQVQIQVERTACCWTSTAWSDARGAYRIDGLASGSYIVKAQLQDYISEYYSVGGGTTNQTHADPVAVLAAQQTSGIAFSLAHQPLPDLQVMTVTAPPTAFSGQAFEVSWEVKNVGNRDSSTSAWVDRIYLSSSATFDLSTSTYLGEALNPAFLAAGESYLQKTTVTMPQGSVGAQYIFVVADTYQNMHESNEANNSAGSPAMQVSLTPPPDLQVSSVTAPANAFSGMNVQLSWRVENIGQGATIVSGWTDQIFLSADTAFDPATDILLGARFHSGTLAMGAAYTETISVPLPQAISGSYVIFIRTDSDNRVFEYVGENNNVSVASAPLLVILTPPPDLEIASITVPATASSGTSIPVSWVVSNNGAGSSFEGSWQDRVYLSTSATFTTTDAIILDTVSHTGNLEPGASVTSSRNLTLPQGISGVYYVHVWTDFDNRIFEFQADTNNTATSTALTIALADSPDLQVSTVTIQNMTGLLAGNAFSLEWTVLNSGRAVAEASWQDTVYLSSSATWTGSGTPLDSITRPQALAAGTQYTQSRSVVVPRSLAAGTYYVYVLTDAANSIYEHNAEDNNSARSVTALSITNLAAATTDLAIDALQAPTTGASGHTISLRWQVSNTTATAVQASSWTDGVYLSSDTTLNASDTRLGTLVHTGELGANNTYQAALDVRLPDGLAGSYSLIFSTDIFSQVNDNNRANNTTTLATPISISLSPPPDLQLIPITPVTDGIAGQPITVRWMVNDLGTGPAEGSWYDGIYLSTNTLLDANDQQLRSQPHLMPLAAGASYSETVSIDLPSITVGSYYLLVKTDSRNEVYEQGVESNNLVSWPITISQPAPADLIVQSVTAPASAAPGQPITIGWTVTNQSTAPASGALCDVVFISADSSWDIGDVRVGEQCYSINLGTGQASQLQLQASMPDAATLAELASSMTNSLTAPTPGTTPGSYFAIVRSDIRNTIYESDESNNSAASTTRIALDVEQLTLGTAAHGTLAQGEARYYRVDVSEGQTLLVSLDSAATDATNELYVSYGQIPTRSHFDYGYSSAMAADQEVTVPTTRAGTYYVLVYGGSSSGHIQSMSTFARLLGFELRSVSPNHGGQGGMITLELRGAFIDSRVTATLIRNNERIDAKTIYWINSSTIFATFDLTNVPLGMFSVLVERENQSSYLDGGFTVEPPLGSGLVLQAIVPGSIRAGQLGVISIDYSNKGNNDIARPKLQLEATNAELRLTTQSSFMGSNILLPPSNWQGPNDILAPGTVGSASIVFRPTTTSGQVTFKVYRIEYFYASRNDGLTFKNVIGIKPTTPSTLAISNEAVMGSAVLSIATQGEPPQLSNGIPPNTAITNEATMSDVEFVQPVKQAIGMMFSHQREIPTSDVEEYRRLVFHGESDLSYRGTKNGYPFDNEAHRGHDYDVPTGTQVRAVASGYIFCYRRNLTNTIDLVVDSDNNGKGDFEVRYDHLQNTCTHSGTFVNAGDIIALSGSSGVNYPHLHFEVGKLNNQSDAKKDITGAGFAVNLRDPFGWWGNSSDPADSQKANTWMWQASDVATTESESFQRFGYRSDWFTKTNTLTLVSNSRGTWFTNDTSYNNSNADTIDWAIWALKAPAEGEYLVQVFIPHIPELKYHESAPYTIVYAPVLQQELIMRQKVIFNQQKMRGWWRDVSSSTIHLMANQTLLLKLETTGLAKGAYAAFDSARLSKVEPVETPKVQVDERTVPIVRSVDPNDIIGPAGYGDARWVGRSNTLGYTIRFENDENLATAPAQRIVIEQPLDNDIDPRSFRLNSFGFGGEVFEVPANRSFYQERLDLVDTLGLFVDVSAGIDLTTKKAFWVLQSIDPATGLPPHDASKGFLPPDIVDGEGQGFVSYGVRPRTTATTGSLIDAQARIVFDTNDPIDTPPIFNTIDAGRPSSQLNALPAETTNPDIVLSWSGSDIAGESGLKSASLYVSIDGTPFTLAQAGIINPTALFHGEPGHSYSFFMLAEDQAGNLEAMKHTAEASTRLFVAGIPTSITLSAEPTTLMVDSSSTSTLRAVVSDGHGMPLAGQKVIFATNLGSLGSQEIVTGADGVATSTLSAGMLPGEATVGAVVDGYETVATRIKVQIMDIPIQGLSITSNSPTILGSTTTLTATVTAGSNVTYAWDFGDGASGIGATVTHSYAAVGSYTAIVIVTNSAGEAHTSTVIQIVNSALPPPTISSVLPDSGLIRGGTSITIQGNGFQPGAILSIDGMPVPDALYVDATSITATSPAHAAGAAAITVTNPDGQKATQAAAFTYLNPAPTLSTLTPAAARAGDPALTLVVTGSDFIEGTVLRWNGSDRPTHVVSATRLTAQISEADLASAGNVPVTIFTPGPGGGLSPSLDFLIEQHSNTDDTLAPVIVRRTPGEEASAVDVKAHIVIQFSEPVEGVDGTSVTLSVNGATLAADVQYDTASRTVTLIPATPLMPNTRYTVLLSARIRDRAGNQLVPVQWQFTTGAYTVFIPLVAAPH